MSSVPRSKDELELAIKSIFPKLMADYHSIPENKVRESGVEGNVKGTVISVSDTVAYLIGWGKLVLKWHNLKSQNQPVDFPETGYKWNQLGLLAESFHEEYRDWKYDDLLVELESTVNEILSLISSLSNYELYGVAWYEQWTLGRMIQFNTSSPMKNMRTKVRRFNREFT
ncbi:ClbS/DfsB family four-helix bundle protein [Vibrio toranzoniae]|uniref:ClbS/DfsB family four-helix bundle protein n=1 Tax=Vibrio toranzoniae TaxID=1194427 RepID=UPI00137862DF|nr:ClbS/DfsB family four-helix bundle protein [Vibrio toranzoniae]NAZ71788.1 ClbS/DfsB family four-helix bundle protein [Vibrio toranzoniae]